MTKPKADKKKARRKLKLQARRNTKLSSQRSDRGYFFYMEALWHEEQNNYDKSLQLLKKALRLKPHDKDYLRFLGHLGQIMKDSEIELDALTRLYQNDLIDDNMLTAFANLLVEKHRFESAIEIIDLLLDRLPAMQIAQKRKVGSQAKSMRDYCRVLKEYIQRGMVKSALILTPTPLVSQWQEELKTKFGLEFPSTDDPDFRNSDPPLWERSFVLASINQAKSKRNVETVTSREYDMVIVDEAHHLKNRNTLNWKLVNALKKRFLLLLTATPVENNLMELYNLITLLKPGQLKTASAFREQFMTKGDPTSPQNRARLKELLGQVMIRNTRALAKINIPPRFAETVRVDPTAAEKELYERITGLVQSINQTNGIGSKLLLKHLLAEAGSSPRAVELTLTRMLGNKELLWDHEKQIQAIRNLSRSMGDTQKNKVLLKLIHGAPGKMIIFVKYVGTLEHITDFLSWQNIPHAMFHGQMTNSEKDAQIESFRGDKNILVTTEIGGEGRNLQFCHQMINYDLPWNPMKIEQRIGRIHRIGQEKQVRIFNLCAANSIEDYILEILDRKINMFEMVIGEIEMVLGRVSGEKDFSERVYDIWLQSSLPDERQKGFDQLSTQLKRSKTRYNSTKSLDEKLFGENYEL